MSHNVEKMMFTGSKPWWYGDAFQGSAIGVDLGEGAVTSEIAMREADLDWEPLKATAGFHIDEEFAKIRDDLNPGWRTAPGDCYLVRSSDLNVLGRCSAEYKPFSNADGFEFLDSLVKTGDLLYHTAGSLEGGKRVWILAQTPTTWTIKRRSGATNTHHAFILAILGHTGDEGIKLMGTDVRAECANTCGFADERAEAENLIFRISHRGDIRSKLDLAGKAIEVMADQAPERREVLQSMAQTAMHTGQFMDFATSIFLGLDGDVDAVKEGLSDFYEVATNREKTIMENKVGAMTRVFLEGQGNEGDTALDAFNAVTEFVDHFDLDHIKDTIKRGIRAAKVVNSAWLGAGAERKALAYKRLAQHVGA